VTVGVVQAWVAPKLVKGLFAVPKLRQLPQLYENQDILGIIHYNNKLLY
jgi:hypothetical protein